MHARVLSTMLQRKTAAAWWPRLMTDGARRLPRTGRQPWLPLLIILYLLLGGTAVLAQPQDRIGQVASVEGQATAQRAGSAQRLPLQVAHPVYQEDTIETGEGGKIRLVLIDETELSLGQHSSMTLSQLVFAPQRHTHRGVVSVAQGVFRAITKQVIPQTTFEIRTGTAVAAVRGTQWLGEVTAQSTAIVVLQGEVAVTHANPAIAGAAVLTQGLGTEVQEKSAPTTPKKWPEPRVFTLLRATALP